MARRSFDALWEKAVARKGEEALKERLPTSASDAVVAATGDDRFLAKMAEVVFSAGFVWRVIRAKWDGFEEAFEGFDPDVVAGYDDEAIGRLGQDTRIVRNRQKITATVQNARYIHDVVAAHGSFGRFVADWPAEDITGLWAELKKRGNRLGGASGPRFLRGMGKETFILTNDVVVSLIEQGIVDKQPTSKAALAKTQAAFNAWRQESGRNLSELSVILACTTGNNVDYGPGPGPR